MASKSLLLEYEIIMREYKKMYENCDKEIKKPTFELCKLQDKINMIDNSIVNLQKQKQDLLHRNKISPLKQKELISQEEINLKIELVKASIGKLKIKKTDENSDKKQTKIDMLKNNLDILNGEFNNYRKIIEKQNNDLLVLTLDNEINKQINFKNEIITRIKELKIYLEYNEIKKKYESLRGLSKVGVT